MLAHIYMEHSGKIILMDEFVLLLRFLRSTNVRGSLKPIKILFSREIFNGIMHALSTFD